MKYIKVVNKNKETKENRIKLVTKTENSFAQLKKSAELPKQMDLESKITFKERFGTQERVASVREVLAALRTECTQTFKPLQATLYLGKYYGIPTKDGQNITYSKFYDLLVKEGFLEARTENFNKTYYIK